MVKTHAKITRFFLALLLITITCNAGIGSSIFKTAGGFIGSFVGAAAGSTITTVFGAIFSTRERKITATAAGIFFIMLYLEKRNQKEIKEGPQ